MKNIVCSLKKGTQPGVSEKNKMPSKHDAPPWNQSVSALGQK
jgi:hypothetical protein